MNKNFEYFRKIAEKRWDKVFEEKDEIAKKAENARKQKNSKNIEQKNNYIQFLNKKVDNYEPFIEKIDKVYREYPFLYHLFQNVLEKIERPGNLIFRIRYSIFIVPYVLLLALFGKKLSIFLHIIIGFPTWKTIQKWKKKIFRKVQNFT